MAKTKTKKKSLLTPSGDLSAVKGLCKFPAAFTQQDESGWFPLHRAVVRPLVAVVEAVLHGGYESQTFVDVRVEKLL